MNVPTGVCLKGLWESVPAHNGLRDPGLPKPTDDGTTFLVTEGAGREDGPAFVTLNTNSTLRGIVLFYPSAPYGLLITNGEFVSFHGPDPTMVDVRAANQGSVRFVNCAFWGPCNQIARIDGSGTVGFSDCTFVEWGGKDGSLAAIQARAGTLLVRGCEFRQDRPQVELGKDVARAVITENVLNGRERIINGSARKVEVAHNIGR